MRAATLLGCADRARELRVLSSAVPFRAQHERTETLAIQGLRGRSAFDAAFGRGRAMTIDDATSFALGGQPAAPTRAVKSAARGPLTRRELEIAQLIARDMNNRQTHIANMVNKLGLSSRLQLGRWLGGLESAKAAPAESEA